jgi:hypothetical protein
MGCVLSAVYETALGTHGAAAGTGLRWSVGGWVRQMCVSGATVTWPSDTSLDAVFLSVVKRTY